MRAPGEGPKARTCALPAEENHAELVIGVKETEAQQIAAQKFREPLRFSDKAQLTFREFHRAGHIRHLRKLPLKRECLQAERVSFPLGLLRVKAYTKGRGLPASPEQKFQKVGVRRASLVDARRIALRHFFERGEFRGFVCRGRLRALSKPRESLLLPQQICLVSGFPFGCPLSCRLPSPPKGGERKTEREGQHAAAEKQHGVAPQEKGAAAH